MLGGRGDCCGVAVGWDGAGMAGEADVSCCLGNWARIWLGVPTRLFGDGSRAAATLIAEVHTPGRQDGRIDAFLDFSSR